LDRVEAIYVIGHKNPDTDSCVSAVALSELRSAEGMENVEAARAGDLNPQTAFIFDYVTTTMANMVETLGAEVIHDFLGAGIATLGVYVGAMQEDSFVEIISFRDPAECIVVVGDREDIQCRAVEMGVALLVVSGGFKPSDGLIELARKKGVSVAVSPHDTATTALLLRFSTPAATLCDGRVDSVLPDTLVDDLRHRLTSMSGVAVLDSEGVMQGFITKSCLLKRSRTGLILVDHNELSQAVDGAEKVEIKGVVDHHRIGNFQTTHAIPFICDPVGSTCDHQVARREVRTRAPRLRLRNILCNVEYSQARPLCGGQCRPQGL
jgi:manganese-dependent inorganic pyrophosphatase